MSILQYLQGSKTGKEANLTEFEAMKDSFLADALDGYCQTKGSHKRQIEKLQNNITRTCNKKPRYGLISGIAAACIIVFGTGIYFLIIEPEAFSRIFASNHKAPVIENKQNIQQPEENNSSRKELLSATTTEEIPDGLEEAQKVTQTDPVPSQSTLLTTNANQHQAQTTEIRRQEPVAQPVQNITGTSTANSIQGAEKTTLVPLQPTPPSVVAEKNQDPTPARTETPVNSTNSETTNDKPASLQNKEPEQVITPEQQQVKEHTATSKIKGRVTDKSGNPLSGASVSIMGANKRTTTNASGYFELEGEDNSNIMVRSLGYDPVVLTGTTTQDLQVSMEEVPKE